MQCRISVYPVFRYGLNFAKNNLHLKKRKNKKIFIVKKHKQNVKINTFTTLVACVPSYYHKNPKISDTRKFAVITLKVEQDGFSLK